MLEIRNISKTFAPGTVNEKKAISGLSLNVEDGDFITIDELRSEFLEFGEVDETFDDFMRNALDKNGSLNRVYQFTFTGCVNGEEFTFETVNAFEESAVCDFLDFVYDKYGVDIPYDDFYFTKRRAE